MWKRKMSDRLTSGTDVRKLIANNGDWKRLVPKSVAHYLEKIADRIMEIYGKSKNSQ